MAGGKKRVEHIPDEWVEEVQRLVEAGREFKEAVAEVFAANAQLLALWGKQRRPVKGPTPRRLKKYVSKCLRLKSYLRSPGDGRAAGAHSRRRPAVGLVGGSVAASCCLRGH